MAEPLRKPPEQPQPERQFNLHRYNTPGSGGSRWWFWVAIAIAIAVFLWWLQAPRSRPNNAAPTTAPAPAPTAKPALDVATLLSNPGQYAGQTVALRDVLVRSTNGSASIFVGTSDAQQVLVILKKDAIPDTLQGKARTLPQGGVVTINGTAEKPGSVKDLEKTANISRAEAEKVSKQGLVIEADRVAPQPM